MSSPPDGWLVERGIGETRAARLAGGAIVEARIEPDGALVAGTVIAARLRTRLPARGEALVVWADGEALLRPVPPHLPEGATLLVEIVRPALPEPGKPKRARARPAADGAREGPPPPLAERLGARVLPAFGADMLAAAGWPLLVEEATTAAVAFPGGALHIALTPAMTLIDVDGDLPPHTLAVRGAAAAAAAAARLDLGGSIGIDLPTVGDKAVRLAAATAIDAALPQPFERTAVNGFGFVQIVRPRARASIPEMFRDPDAHARALLRAAERSAGHGERRLSAHPVVVARIAARPDWVRAVEAATGAPLALRADATLVISGGHVQALHP